MPRRDSSVKKETRPKLAAKLQSRLDSVDGRVFLDLSGIESESIVATDIDDLSVHSNVLDLSVREFKGTVDVGRAEQLTVCRRLRLVNCSINTMTASRAAFEECEFVDCNFRALRAVGASFVRCTFSGLIRSAIFQRESRPRGLGGAQELLPFEGNDFSHCELLDTDFRGGIDLRKQTFSTQQQQLIIPAATQLLAQLDAYMLKTRAGAGVRKFHEFLRRSVVDFKQEEVFVSTDILRKTLAPHLRDFRGKVAEVSPAFARWAATAERALDDAGKSRP
jgi:hypothetical protein